MSTKTGKWVNPAVTGFKKTVQLSGGKAEIRVAHATDTVDAKVYVYGRPYRGLDGKGKIQTAKVRVQATTIRVKLPNGEVLKARSCCKPPDQFHPIIGVQLAAQRVIKGKSALNNADRMLILKTIHDTISPPKPKVQPTNGATATNGSPKKVAAAARKVTE